jgi:DNA-binding response OmpR family regulator
MPGDGSSARVSAHHVLIIDGDGAMRRLLRLALNEFDCNAYAARDGPESLAMLGKYPICTVIVDVPGISCGRRSVLRALSGARKGRQPSIIAISSTSASLIVAARFGADATLLKPFSLQQLRAAIEYLAVSEEPPHAPMTPLRLRSVGSRPTFAGDTSREPFAHHTRRSWHHG